MIRRRPGSTLFPYTPIFRSPEIVRAAFRSVAKRILEMDPLSGEVVMTGGVVAHHPALVDMVAERILASLGIDSRLMKPWLGPEPLSYSEEGIQ